MSVAVDVYGVRRRDQQVRHGVAIHVTDQQAPLIARPSFCCLRFRRGKGRDAPSAMIVKTTAVGHNDLVVAIAVPIEQTVVPAVVGHDTTEQGTAFVKDADWTLATGAVVDVHENLEPWSSGMTRPMSIDS